MNSLVLAILPARTELTIIQAILGVLLAISTVLTILTVLTLTMISIGVTGKFLYKDCKSLASFRAERRLKLQSLTR